MSVLNENKLNRLLKDWPAGTVHLTAWLNERGYSNQLLNRYKKSKWLQSIGQGAWIRDEDKVGYTGAIYALQQQLGLSVHPGGRSAFSLLGSAHYLELAPTKVVLFGQAKEALPAWCRNRDWGLKLDYHQSSFLPVGLGMMELKLEHRPFSIKVSSPARALMECLYLAPNYQDLVECFELMEGVNNAHPKLVQQLLEQCSSVKVKRFFIYMAEKIEHNWFRHLKLQKIDVGKGKRSLVKNRVVYVPKYQITVPRELEDYGKLPGL